MKRDKLIGMLTAAGCTLLRHGGRHDIYVNPQNGLKQPVPRHRSIALHSRDETLARHILKYLGIR